MVIDYSVGTDEVYDNSSREGGEIWEKYENRLKYMWNDVVSCEVELYLFSLHTANSVASINILKWNIIDLTRGITMISYIVLSFHQGRQNTQ